LKGRIKKMKNQKLHIKFLNKILFNTIAFKKLFHIILIPIIIGIYVSSHGADNASESDKQKDSLILYNTLNIGERNEINDVRAIITKSGGKLIKVVNGEYFNEDVFDISSFFPALPVAIMSYISIDGKEYLFRIRYQLLNDTNSLSGVKSLDEQGLRNLTKNLTSKYGKGEKAKYKSEMESSTGESTTWYRNNKKTCVRLVTFLWPKNPINSVVLLFINNELGEVMLNNKKKIIDGYSNKSKNAF